MSRSDRHMIIIGGGLAGLSAGCYALKNGFSATIVEHNAALGGVCTAWQRGPYTIDGCIHWLTGGPFERLYQELEILPAVRLRTLDQWICYRDVESSLEVPVTRDLGALFAQLGELSPEDRPELERMRRGAACFGELRPPIESREVASLASLVRDFWSMRFAASTLMHFRKPMGEWAREHIESPRLQRLFVSLVPETAPALFLLMVLGYLERGHLSRPIGGTTAFRDALVQSYLKRGGQVRLQSTVDEVLVSGGKVKGVVLADGSILESDLVVSTASTPETVLGMLGGAYEAQIVRDRLDNWKLFDPIVLASFCVNSSYAGCPSLLLLDHTPELETGGRTTDQIYLRICNDGPGFAPAGHTVIQAMLPSDYHWWATRSDYQREKDALAGRLLSALEGHFPDLRAAVEYTDIATPLTFWKGARSWRGAYEGWMPNGDSFFGQVKKTLSGLSGFYMAGQWVEPGGGVPVACMSGRQVVELICSHQAQKFKTS